MKTRIQAESAARGNDSEADDDGNGFWCPQWVTKLARVFREEGAAGGVRGGAGEVGAFAFVELFVLFSVQRAEADVRGANGEKDWGGGDARGGGGGGML